MKTVFKHFLVMSLLFGVVGCQQGLPAKPTKASGAQAKLPTAKIEVGGVAVEAELAVRAETREYGYMFRKAPADGEGMLFVWPTDRPLIFWMKDTPFDIDIGYISAEGKMFQISRMKAFEEKPIYSMSRARYALEVAAGWFEKHGLHEGLTVRIPPEVKSTEDDKFQK